MRITIWGNALNVVLAVVFVEGLLGVEPMGVSGVGYATLIDRCLMAAVMGAYVFRSVNFKVYLERFSLFHVDLPRCRSILKIGAPVAMQYVFEVGDRKSTRLNSSH